MEKRRILYHAAALAGLLISLTSALPVLSRPVFNLYVITAILVLII
ncbi:MAG TPA: hypothetical protein VHF69_02210 [Candidatus Synoicihabitans sp.]|nr:hypothetical protein [Candidatus Synoicihabitans sp.]